MDVDLGTISTGREYHDSFEPKSYLGYRFQSVNERHAEVLRHLHQFYLTVPVGVKVLDVGSGPIIAYVISAATRASEIVLSEYTKKNRDEIQRWIDGSPKAHDWGPYFTFIVQKLEGKENQEVTKRAQQLRQIIKAVVPCDITKDPPIDGAFAGPYDVITSSLCLEAACSTADEYTDAVVRMWRLLKEGGRLLLQCVEGPSTTHFYMVGTKKFTVLSATPRLIRTALEKTGFHDITITQLPKNTVGNKEASSDYTAMYLVIATK